MREDKFSKSRLILYACGIIPAAWLALLLAPYVSGGLVELVRYGGTACRWKAFLLSRCRRNTV